MFDPAIVKKNATKGTYDRDTVVVTAFLRFGDRTSFLEQAAMLVGQLFQPRPILFQQVALFDQTADVGTIFCEIVVEVRVPLRKRLSRVARIFSGFAIRGQGNVAAGQT